MISRNSKRNSLGKDIVSVILRPRIDLFRSLLRYLSPFLIILAILLIHATSVFLRNRLSNNSNRFRDANKIVSNSLIKKRRYISEGRLPFEQIFCLNLDRRRAKWDGVLQELKNSSVNTDYVIRVPAIDGTQFSKEAAIQLIRGGVFASLNFCKSKRIFNGSISVGQLGHYLSFRQIFQHALQRGMKNVLLIEDDILIRNPASFLQDIWAAYSELPPDWDYLYLYLSKVCFSFSRKQVIENTHHLTKNKSLRRGRCPTLNT